MLGYYDNAYLKVSGLWQVHLAHDEALQGEVEGQAARL